MFKQQLQDFADRARKESEMHERQLKRTRLEHALAFGTPGAIMEYCRWRAALSLSKDQEISETAATGTLRIRYIRYKQEDIEQASRNMWRWFHRICSWWDIDLGYKKGDLH